jgi:2,3-diaminopropionate biosynthesis protein SbnA
MHKAVSDVINDQVFLKVKDLGLSDFHLKLEFLNPAGSVKIKTALGLIDDIVARGLINQNTILIESSSGNLGVALAMICAERGLQFTCVVDPNSSAHNIKIMKTFGASVVVVEKRDENGGYLGTRINYIRETVQRDKRFVWLNQYENPSNPRIHARMTAQSIANTFAHIDYLFVGAGTTGTLMGCVQFFRTHRPETKIVAVDSIGSVTFGNPPSKRYIPGLGTSQCPPIFDPSGIHAFEMVAESRAIEMCRYMARTNGLLVGGSTGSVLAGVFAWLDRLPQDAAVVAIAPDSGERYLDTIYDDEWVTARFGDCLLSKTIDSRVHAIGSEDTSSQEPRRHSPRRRQPVAQ